MLWYVYPVVAILVLYAFRKKIISILSDWYSKYTDKKKHDQLMARLHSGDTRFSQKDYLKQLQAQKKAMLKKNRELQDDRK